MQWFQSFTKGLPRLECNCRLSRHYTNFINGAYKPYHEPENALQYIHKESNHPPNIIKQIQITIEK